jgi:hypothetical protein
MQQTLSDPTRPRPLQLYISAACVCACASRAFSLLIKSCNTVARAYRTRPRNPASCHTVPCRTAPRRAGLWQPAPYLAFTVPYTILSRASDKVASLKLLDWVACHVSVGASVSISRDQPNGFADVISPASFNNITPSTVLQLLGLNHLLASSSHQWDMYRSVIDMGALNLG